MRVFLLSLFSVLIWHVRGGDLFARITTLSDIIRDARDRWFEDLPPWLRVNPDGSISIGDDHVGFNLEWNLGEIVTGGRQAPWWKGPNVCVTRDQQTDGDGGKGDKAAARMFAGTSCEETDAAYTCTSKLGFGGDMKVFKVTYECCHGYVHEIGQSGCSEVPQMTDLLTTMEDLNATDYAKAIRDAGLEERISEGNYTLFVPSDEALEPHWSQVITVTPELMAIAKDLESGARGHTVPGFVRSSDFKDEQLLSTESPGVDIRINTYQLSNKPTFANCVSVRSVDHYATNGIVHMVDGALPMVTESLAEIIGASDQFTFFKSVLDKVDMTPELEGKGQYTVFVPSNKAFEKLEPDVRDSLLRGGHCLQNIVKHHILPHVICSSVIQGRAKTRNLLNRYVVVSREDGGEPLVNNVLVYEVDKMATNGVIHVIDQVLVPEEALSMVHAAKRAETGKLLELMDSSRLTKVLESATNITLFAPTDQAFKELSPELQLELTEDPELLAKVLKYHIVPTVQSSSNLVDGAKMETLGSSKELAVNTYGSRPFSSKRVVTVQCAPVEKTDFASCNGPVHTISKVMLPPSGDIVDILYQKSQFSKLVELLKAAGGDLVDELQRMEDVTFYAPTNKAFEDWTDEEMENLLREEARIEKFIKHHIVPDVICCAGVFNSHWMSTHRVGTMTGDRVILRHRRDKVTVADIPVKTCDIMATNGVVHAIQDILPGSTTTRRRHRGHRRGSRPGQFLTLEDIFNLEHLVNWNVDFDFDWGRN